MKKSILLSLSLVVMLLMTACGGDDKVTLTIYGPNSEQIVNDLVLPATAGRASLTMNLKVNELTSVTLDQEDPNDQWCKLYYEGVANQIFIEYTTNEQMKERHARLRIVYSGSSRVIDVVQAPKLGIWDFETCYVVPKDGGSMSITFQKNTECGIGQGIGGDAFSITGINQTDLATTVTLDITPNRGFGRVMSIVVKPTGASDIEIALWQQPREFAASEDIVLGEAGTLAARIGCEYANIANITELTIAGKINGADVAYMRELCNRQFMASHEGVTSAIPNLKLNLIDASIVDGSNSKFASLGIGQPDADQLITTAKNVVPQRMLTGATRLEGISLPETATLISDHAFYYCPQLTYVRLPRDIEVIGNSAFQSCELLTEVDFGDILEIGSSLTTIEEYAFSNVGVLRTFFFPASLINLPKTGLNFKVKTLFALWPTPPTIENGPNPEGCTLYVPRGSVDAYSSAAYWSEFENIIAL